MVHYPKITRLYRDLLLWTTLWNHEDLFGVAFGRNQLSFVVSKKDCIVERTFLLQMKSWSWKKRPWAIVIGSVMFGLTRRQRHKYLWRPFSASWSLIPNTEIDFWRGSLLMEKSRGFTLKLVTHWWIERLKIGYFPLGDALRRILGVLPNTNRIPVNGYRLRSKVQCFLGLALGG